MSYLSTDSIDHGLIKLANRSYGGFAYRAGTMENMWPTGNEDAQDPTKRFITQHKYGEINYWIFVFVNSYATFECFPLK
jgi:hypothetical protein